MVQTDAKVGRILRALEDNGFTANTLVVFTADNGAERYAYDRIRNFGHRSSARCAGLKRDLYEGGHRVPFVVKWPGVVQPGTVSDTMSSQVDLMATLAAVVGHELPANTATMTAMTCSRCGSTTHQPAPQHRPQHVRRRLCHPARPVGIDRREKRRTSQVPAWFDAENHYRKNDHPGELYDLSTDLPQRHNLYADRPEKVRELTGLLEQIRAKGQVR